MNTILLLPIILPFLGGVVLLAARRRRGLQRVLAVIGTGVQTAAALALLVAVRTQGIQSVQLGDWPAPFGITLVADLFSGIMVVMASVTVFLISIYSLHAVDAERASYGYYPLTQLLLMGVCGSFLTGDIFNLYVWFEVMLMASFVLLALGGERPQMEGAIKYVALNLFASAMFLAGVGILYGTAGTLNMADLAVKLGQVDQPGLVTTLAILFLVAFGVKAAIFPLFFWLPASYHTPPIAITAIFAGLLTKVGVYALIRVNTLLFVHDVDYTHQIILVLAGITMLTGVLGAAAHFEFRRILSFHIVSQIGYMIMGLALMTPLALAGSIFFLVHNIVVKTNLFLISGLVYRLRGSYELKKLGGLYRSHPGLSILFLISALALAGLPPLSGFFAKFYLIMAGLERQEYVIVGVALLTGMLTLFSMTKIWAEVFWKDSPGDPGGGQEDRPELKRGERVGYGLPIMALTGVAVLLSIGAAPVYDLFISAGEQLMNPEGYIEAVLGEQP